MKKKIIIIIAVIVCIICIAMGSIYFINKNKTVLFPNAKENLDVYLDGQVVEKAYKIYENYIKEGTMDFTKSITKVAPQVVSSEGIVIKSGESFYIDIKNIQKDMKNDEEKVITYYIFNKNEEVIQKKSLKSKDNIKITIDEVTKNEELYIDIVVKQGDIVIHYMTKFITF